MTRAHYYSTTKSLTANLFKYGLYPIVYFGTYSATKGNEAKATALASAITGGCAALLTTDYFGKEATMLLSNAREAVASELGMNPKELQFSDLYKSHNTIVRKELHDLMSLQKIRYATDSIFLLPTALILAGKMFPALRNYVPGGTPPIKVGPLHSSWKEAAKAVGQNPITSAMLGYAGMSGYWVWENLGLPKSAHYELVKLRENIESTHGEVTANDILRVYQRNLVDQKQWMLTHDTGQIQAVMPLLERVAELCNSRANWGTSQLTYLIGNNKIQITDNPQDPNAPISAGAIERSRQEIEKLANLGLSGIGEENRQDPAIRRRREEPVPLSHKVVDAAYTAFGHLQGTRNRTYEEIISSRNRNDAKEPHFEELVSSRDPASGIYTGRG